MTKRILFLYLTKHSGHYAAAVALDEVLRRLDSHLETMLLDSFSHTNPVLSRVTLKTYLAVLKTAPEVWEFLYDNPEVMEKTAKIRELLNRGNSKRLQSLLADFDPDIVVCTQAFACGVIAAWKKAMRRDTPKLVGILTDFVAHRYWAHEAVDLYIAPTEETGQTLIAQGVPPERVKASGLPICTRFNKPVDKQAVLKSLRLSAELPKVLVMGGSLGLVPMKSVLRKLNKLPQPFDIIAVTGKNEQLMEELQRKRGKSRREIRVFGFAENIQELMEIADILVTKPGGVTTAEALAKRLPMIIINPIPGQEAKNTEFLLSHNVALEAEDANDVMLFVDDFLRNPEKLRKMREAAQTLGRPHAAEEASHHILQLLSAKAMVTQ